MGVDRGESPRTCGAGHLEVERVPSSAFAHVRGSRARTLGRAGCRCAVHRPGGRTCVRERAPGEPRLVDAAAAGARAQGWLPLRWPFACQPGILSVDFLGSCHFRGSHA